MYNLIINTKSDFDATICEQLVRYFGKLEVIPYSERFCVVQGIEIEEKNWFFSKTMIFFTEQKEHLNKLLLVDVKVDFEDNIHLLNRITLDGVYSLIEPPKYTLGTSVPVSDGIWKILPFELDY